MKILLFDPEAKPLLARSFAINYPAIAASFVNYDIDVTETIISISVQLFTTPSIVYDLVTKYDLLSSLLRTFDIYLNKMAHSTDILLSRSTRNIYRYLTVIRDINYVLECTKVQALIKERIQSVLPLLISIFGHLQGLDSEVRQTDRHVEYEMGDWIFFMEVIKAALGLFMYPLLTLISHDPDPRSCVIQEVSRAIRQRYFETLVDMTSDTFFYGDSMYQIILTRHDRPVSVCHAYHWLVSFLLSKHHLTTTDDLSTRMNQMIEWFTGLSVDTEKSEPAIHIMAFVNEILQPFWLRAEIKAKLWVRNGIAIIKRSLDYFRGKLLNAPMLDLHLLQLALCVVEPDVFLHYILYAFHLVQERMAIDGKRRTLVFTEDTDMALIMAVELTQLLIAIVSERTLISHMDSNECLKRELIHALAAGPLAYSKIQSRVCTKFEDCPQIFSSCLNEVADYRPAESLAEQGCYVLKDSFLHQQDPYSFLFLQVYRSIAENYRRSREAHSGIPSRPACMLIPKCYKLASGYDRMYRLFMSRMFGDLLYVNLIWIRRHSESNQRDGLLDGSLRLLLLPFHDVMSIDGGEQHDTIMGSFLENILAVRHIEGGDYPEGSLLTLLWELRQLSDINMFHVAIDEFFRLLQMKAATIVDGSLEKLQQGMYQLSHPVSSESSTSLVLGTSQEDDASIQERSKMAKERQLQAFKEIQEKQRRFLAKYLKQQPQPPYQHSMDLQEEETIMMTNDTAILEEGESGMNDIMGTCLSCREALSRKNAATKPFGFLGFYQPSNMRRYIRRDTTLMPEILNYAEKLWNWHQMARDPCNSCNLQASQQEIQSIISQMKQSLQSEMRKQIRCFVRTCGHLAHVACTKNYLTNVVNQHRHISLETLSDVSLFPCPLCHALCNTIIPVLDDTMSKKSSTTVPLSPLFVLKRQSQQQQPQKDDELTILSDYRILLLETINYTPTIETESFRRYSAPSRRWWPRSRQPLSPSLNTARFIHPPRDDNEEMNQETTRTDSPDEFLSEIIEDNLQDLSWRFIHNALTTTTRMSMISLQEPLVFATTLAYTISCHEMAARDSYTSIHKELFFQLLPETQTLFLREFMLFAAHMYEEMTVSDVSLLVSSLEQFLALGEPRNIDKEEEKNEQDEQGEEETDSENPSPAAFRRFKAHPSIHEIETFDLVVILYVLSPALRSEPHLLFRLAFLAEAVKILLHMAHDPHFYDLFSHQPSSDRPLKELHFLENLQTLVYTLIGVPNSPQNCRLFYLLRLYLLPLLRKLGCLYYCIFNIPVAEQLINDEERDEFDKLMIYLQIQFPEDLWCDSSTTTIFPTSIQTYIRNICFDWKQTIRSRQMCMIPIESPLYPQLISIPEKYQTYLEELKELHCSSCKERPTEPAICLFCGTVVCTRTQCCRAHDRGEVYNHTFRYVFTRDQKQLSKRNPTIF
jgi:hypothetical protein